MKRSRVLSAMMITGALFFACAVGCETSQPYGLYGNANAGYYDYDYYPDSEVYFQPSVNVYYWHEGNEWHHGRDLPRNYAVNHNNHVNVRLHTDKPYTMHEQVRSEHPGHPH